MPERPLTELFADQFDEPIDVLELLSVLLDDCEAQRFPLYEAMSDFTARCFKSRIRCFCRQLLEAIDEIAIPVTCLPMFDAVLGRPGTPLPSLSDYLDSLTVAIRAAASAFPGDLAAWEQAIASIGVGLDLGSPVPGGQIVIIRGLAQAIDDVFRDRFVPAFERANAGAGEVDVREGTVIPSKPGDCWYTVPAYRLDRSDDHPGHLLHVRRIKVPLGVQLRINSNRRTSSIALTRFVDPQRQAETARSGVTSAPAQVPTSGFSRRIGFVCLGPSQRNFADTHRILDLSLPQHTYSPGEQHPEDAWTRGPSIAGLRQFRHVHWKGHQKSFLELVLQAAQREQVDLLLLPELTLTSTAERFLRRRLRELTPAEPRYPSLVIAGSRHVESSSDASSGPPIPRWRNRLIAFAASDRNTLADSNSMSLEHDKIGTFLFPDQDRYNVVEAIERPRHLRVYLCDGVLTCCLICKDVLQSSVLDSLQAAGVRRLIVVAMSQRVDEFAFHLSELAIRSNTHSWLICASVSGQITAGIFGPGLRQTAVLLRNGSPTSFSSSGTRSSRTSPTGQSGNADEAAATGSSQSYPTGSPGALPAPLELPTLAIENGTTVAGRGLWVATMPFPSAAPDAGWFRPIDPTFLRGRTRPNTQVNG